MNAIAQITPDAHLAVDYHMATTMLETALRSNLVPMMAGSPGVGKSALVHAVAKKFNLKVIDLRLAQCDPTDLLGFPSIDKERDKALYVPMATFPIEGDSLPVNPETKRPYDGWLLFLDEFNSADRSVAKAAYKLVLDRMIGQFHLHPNVAIVCAGNLETDNAIVEEMSTALQSRLVHMELRTDSRQWLEWAATNNIDYRVTSYINFRPDDLYSFKPDHTDKTFACPRTWEFASKLLAHTDTSKPEFTPLMAGTLSPGIARHFTGFLKVHTELPSIQDILAQPETIAMPSEQSVLYALTGTLAHHAKPENMEPLFKFLSRMPPEFQMVTVRDMYRRKPELGDHEVMVNWMDSNAEDFF